MNKRFFSESYSSHISLIMLVLMFMPGCANNIFRHEQPIRQINAIEQFSDEQEVKDYLLHLKRNYDLKEAVLKKLGRKNGLDEIIVTARRTEEKSITNNQEKNVDEGDIVKLSGDNLFVLRHGELFSVKLDQGGHHSMVLQDHKKVVGQMKDHDAWYDEMLVYGNKVLILGYSYELRSTELIFFKFDELGTLSYEKTYILKSSDYFDMSNYAIRQIGNKIIFYNPYYLYVSGKLDAYKEYVASAFLPLKAIRYQAGSDIGKEIILSRTRKWYKPIEDPDFPVVNNIVQCALDTPEFTCDVTSILNSGGANFYVSANAFYLWSNDEAHAFNVQQLSDSGFEKFVSSGNWESWRNDRSSYLYRIDHESGQVGVAQVKGGVSENQFQFSESEGNLFAVVTIEPEQDGKTSTLMPGIYGLRVNGSDFQQELHEVSDTAYQLITSSSDSPTCRFSNGYALVSISTYGDQHQPDKNETYAWNQLTNEVSTLQSEFFIYSFHPVGGAMVALGETNKGDLAIQTYGLGSVPRLIDKKILDNTSAVETRSHGFNSANINGDNLFGVPVLTGDKKQRTAYFNQDSLLPTNMNFYQLSSSGFLSDAGVIKGGDIQKSAKACEASCVDWYGAARPFFIGERIYSLMGYELVEGVYRNGYVVSGQRLRLSNE